MKPFYSVPILLLLLAFPLFSESHAVVYNDEGVVKNASDYFILGIKHIIPFGIDHLIFLVGLFLSSRKLKTILGLATAFTVAHTITLILTATGFLPSKPEITEPIIGLTIAMVGLENIMTGKYSVSSYILVFVFGLIHGCGFATALSEAGIPSNYFMSSLISFNIGIEVAQLSIILFLFGLTFKWKNEITFKRYLTIPVSVLIICIGLYFTVEQLYQRI